MKKQKKTNYKETNLSKIKIEPPKGRPMLHWAGKKPLEHIKSFPEQLVQVYNPLDVSIIEKPLYDILKENWHNLLFHGDNKEVLGFLLNNGFRSKIDLIYIDPPFDSGADYVRNIQLRGKDYKEKMQAEDYKLGEQVQYFDIWNNDGYLQFIFERLQLLKELLNTNGSIYLHTDWHKSHLLRCIMDEVFGDGGKDGNEPGYKGEVVWCYKTRQFSKNYWNRKHQCILFYSKGNKWTFNWEAVANEYSESTIKKYKKGDKNGKYRLDGRGIKGSPIILRGAMRRAGH